MENNIIILMVIAFLILIIGSLYFILNYRNINFPEENNGPKKEVYKEEIIFKKKRKSKICGLLRCFYGYGFIIIIILTIILGRGTLSGFAFKIPSTIMIFGPFLFGINELFIKRVILKEKVHIINIIIGIICLLFSLFLIKGGVFGILFNI